MRTLKGLLWGYPMSFEARCWWTHRRWSVPRAAWGLREWVVRLRGIGREALVVGGAICSGRDLAVIMSSGDSLWRRRFSPGIGIGWGESHLFSAQVWRWIIMLASDPLISCALGSLNISYNVTLESGSSSLSMKFISWLEYVFWTIFGRSNVTLTLKGDMRWINSVYLQ